MSINPDQGKIQLDIQKIIVQLKLDQNNYASHGDAALRSANISAKSPDK